MLDIEYNIYLHGSLAKTYGKQPFTVFGKSLHDAMQGMVCNLGERFKATIRDNNWHVTKGNRDESIDIPIETDNFISPEEVPMYLPVNEIHIFPAITGAGGKGMGIGKIIMGIILVVVAVVMFWNPVGWVAWAGLIGGVASGVATIASGVASLTTSTPVVKSYSSAEVDKKSSFIFNGPVNVVEQGGPVPLVYGRHMTGSVVVSAGLTSQQPDATTPRVLPGTVTTLGHTGTSSNVVMSQPHGLAVGNQVSISGAIVNGVLDPYYNGTFIVQLLGLTDTTFSYVMAGTPSSNASGTIVAKVYG